MGVDGHCVQVRSFNSASCCWLCYAEPTRDLAYMDFRPEAAHRQKLISHNSYMLAFAAERARPSAAKNLESETVAKRFHRWNSASASSSMCCFWWRAASTRVSFGASLSTPLGKPLADLTVQVCGFSGSDVSVSAGSMAAMACMDLQHAPRPPRRDRAGGEIGAGAIASDERLLR